jgi:hypothetical protein
MSDLVIQDPNLVAIGDALDVQGHDLLLRDAHRINEGSKHGTLRRALVHDFQDGLTINYNHDYPGGVTILDLKAVPETVVRTRGPHGGGGGPPAPIRVADAILALQREVEQLRHDLVALSARVP